MLSRSRDFVWSHLFLVCNYIIHLKKIWPKIYRKLGMKMSEKSCVIEIATSVHNDQPLFNANILNTYLYM